jgi:hypothetical protein
MSNFRPLSGQGQARIPTPPRGEPIAHYDTYLEAQRAVDYLSDHAFPVQFVTIVGTGLQMVERVTGRLTYPRVALAGAASGAWFGLFVGLVLSLFGGNEGALLAAPLFGAGFGVLFGVISYGLTGGRRDFTSTSQIVAGEYAVLCLAEQAGAARQLLRQLPGGTGRDQPRTPVAPSGPAATPPTTGTPGGWPSQGGYGQTGYGQGGYGQGGYGQGDSGATSHGQPLPPYGAPEQESGQPTGAPSGQPATPAAPDEPGLTYGEAIERQKRERLERERLERERQSNGA